MFTAQGEKFLCAVICFWFIVGKLEHSPKLYKKDKNSFKWVDKTRNMCYNITSSFISYHIIKTFHFLYTIHKYFQNNCQIDGNQKRISYFS